MRALITLILLLASSSWAHDVQLRSALDLDNEAIALKSVMRAISGAHFAPYHSDACPDNPFAKKMQQKTRLAPLVED